MDKDQTRFYNIMGCYLDDERLAAHAIVFFLHPKISPENIYRDILSCKYGKWVDQLEQIAENTRWDILRDFCAQKQFELDMMRSDFWSCGDNAMLEKEDLNKRTRGKQ